MVGDTGIISVKLGGHGFELSHIVSFFGTVLFILSVTICLHFVDYEEFFQMLPMIVLIVLWSLYIIATCCYCLK